MPMLRNTMTMALGLAGALSLSQAPEFAQQYRQRLGGALEELAQVVLDFDADAAKNGLSRQDALALYMKSDQPFFHDRGIRMQDTIARVETLAAQARWFEELPPLARPVALARGYDAKLMDGLWKDYEPAMPLTPQGGLWAGAGFGIAALLFRLVTMPFARWRRRRQLRREIEALSAPPERVRRAVRAPG